MLDGATLHEGETTMVHYGYGYGGDAHPWLWVLMVVAMLAFVAAATWIIVTLARHRDGAATPAAPAAPAAPALSEGRRILDERFARGDIDEDEYRRRRSVMEGDG